MIKAVSKIEQKNILYERIQMKEKIIKLNLLCSKGENDKQNTLFYAVAPCNFKHNSNR